MIEKVIAWSIRRRELIALGAIFMLIAGSMLLRTMPVDAIPDLSDTQVIVYTDYLGQAPQVVEDQVTYPLLTTFLSIPRVKVVRGQSMFSSSFVYVIFQDGTDLYWARSRVLEYLNAIQSRLPAGAKTRLGPDATGVGWVYQYALEGPGYSPDRLRSIQDFQVRYALQSVPGVAEVASLGGFVKQYQVLQPGRGRAHGGGRWVRLRDPRPGLLPGRRRHLGRGGGYGQGRPARAGGRRGPRDDRPRPAPGDCRAERAR